MFKVSTPYSSSTSPMACRMYPSRRSFAKRIMMSMFPGHLPFARGIGVAPSCLARLSCFHIVYHDVKEIHRGMNARLTKVATKPDPGQWRTLVRKACASQNGGARVSTTPKKKRVRYHVAGSSMSIIVGGQRTCAMSGVPVRALCKFAAGLSPCTPGLCNNWDQRAAPAFTETGLHLASRMTD